MLGARQEAQIISNICSEVPSSGEMSYDVYSDIGHVESQHKKNIQLGTHNDQTVTFVRMCRQSPIHRAVLDRKESAVALAPPQTDLSLQDQERDVSGVIADKPHSAEKCMRKLPAEEIHRSDWLRLVRTIQANF